jgi:hypothetical protein
VDHAADLLVAVSQLARATTKLLDSWRAQVVTTIALLLVGPRAARDAHERKLRELVTEHGFDGDEAGVSALEAGSAEEFDAIAAMLDALIDLPPDAVT